MCQSLGELHEALMECRARFDPAVVAPANLAKVVALSGPPRCPSDPESHRRARESAS